MTLRSKNIFPPLSNDEWWEKIKLELKGKDPETVYWKTEEGFTLKPFYTKDDLNTFQDTMSYRNNLLLHSLQHSNSGIGNPIIPLNCEFPTSVLAYLGSEVDKGSNIFYLYTGNTIPSDNEWLVLFSSILQVPHHRFYLSYGLYQNLISRTFDIPASTQPLIHAYKYTLHHAENNYGIDIRFVYEQGGSMCLQLAVLLSGIVDLYEQTEKNKQKLGIFNRDTFTIHLSVSTQLLLEIAKLRAIRILYDLLMRELSVETYPAIHLVAHTANRDQASYDIHNNIIRNTIAALSGIWGGCQEICVLPHIGAQQPVDSFATRIARNIPLLLTHESHVDKVLDPWAGSYHLEIMTDHIINQSWELFHALETEGGTRIAWEKGWLQEQLERFKHASTSHYRQGKKEKIGVSIYSPEDVIIPEEVLTQLF